MLDEFWQDKELLRSERRADPSSSPLTRRHSHTDARTHAQLFPFLLPSLCMLLVFLTDDERAAEHFIIKASWQRKVSRVLRQSLEALLLFGTQTQDLRVTWVMRRGWGARELFFFFFFYPKCQQHCNPELKLHRCGKSGWYFSPLFRRASSASLFT